MYEKYLKERKERIETNSIHQESMNMLFDTAITPLVPDLSRENEGIWYMNFFMGFIILILSYVFIFQDVSNKYFKPSLNKEFSIITGCLVLEVYFYVIIASVLIRLILTYLKQSTINAIITEIKNKRGKNNNFLFNFTKSIFYFLSTLIMSVFYFFYLKRSKNLLVCFIETTNSSYCQYNRYFTSSIIQIHNQKEELSLLEKTYTEFVEVFESTLDVLKLGNSGVFIYQNDLVFDQVHSNSCMNKLYKREESTNDNKRKKEFNYSTVSSGKPIIQIFYTDKIKEEKVKNNDSNSENLEVKEKDNSTDDSKIEFKAKWYELILTNMENKNLFTKYFNVPRLEMFINKLGYESKYLSSSSSYLTFLTLISSILNQNEIVLDAIKYEKYDEIGLNKNNGYENFAVQPNFIKVKSYNVQFNGVHTANKIGKYQYQSVVLKTVSKNSLNKIIGKFELQNSIPNSNFSNLDISKYGIIALIFIVFLIKYLLFQNNNTHGKKTKSKTN
jgi:hypothetical protein